MKAQMKIGYIIGVLVITLMAVALVLAPIMGVQSQTLSKLFGSGPGDVLGSKQVVTIKPGTGYDFDGKGNYGGKMGYEIGEERRHYGADIYYTNPISPLMGGDGVSSMFPGSGDWYVPCIEKPCITQSEDAAIIDLKGAQFLGGDAQDCADKSRGDGWEECHEEIVMERRSKMSYVDCAQVSEEEYVIVPLSVGLASVETNPADHLCVKTSRDHIVHVEIIKWEPPTIKWWYQELNYEGPASGVAEEDVELKRYTTIASFQVEADNDLTGKWYGFDFDKTDVQYNEIIPNNEWDNIDFWYDKDDGIIFDSGERIDANDERDWDDAYHHQQGFHQGASGTTPCSQIPPMLYHPNNEELGYAPKLYKNDFYCIITSENRVVKMKWLSEPGEEAKFEWFYES